MHSNFIFCGYSFYSSSNQAALPVRPEDCLSRSIEGRDRAAKNFTIMINPAGDAEHKGRLIDDAFERSITLALAHALKNQIEQLTPHIRVILTRTAGEIIREHANANFANRLDVDLFLSLHCFAETQTRPQLAIYTFAYGDQGSMRLPDLAFYPFDQAYLLHQDDTQKYAHAMEQTLKGHTNLYDMVGVCKVPFKPLMGVTAPAIGIEIGLKNKQSWQNFVMPLAEAIIEVMKIN